MQDQTTEQETLPRLMWPGEVARLLAVDPKTVSRWASEGKLPSIRTPGGQRRFRENEMLAIRDGGRTDLNTLLIRAAQVADKVEFDWRDGLTDNNSGVTCLAWKNGSCEYATAAQPAEALAAAVAKLSAYLTGSVS